MSGFKSGKKVAALERHVSTPTDMPWQTTKEHIDAVIKLHDIARLITASFHPKYSSQLSKDIRECADRLEVLIK